MIFLHQPVNKSCYEPTPFQNGCPSSQYGVVFLTPNPSSACAKQQQKPDPARQYEKTHKRQQQQHRRTAESKVYRQSNIARKTTESNYNDISASPLVVVQKPRIHQEETATNITMALDVAGYSINDLNIHIDQETNILAISGARVNRLGSKYVFQRRLALKVVRLNLDTFHATLKDDGILEISVQKRDHRSSRVIPIGTAAATTSTATTTEADPMDHNEENFDKPQEDTDSKNSFDAQATTNIVAHASTEIADATSAAVEASAGDNESPVTSRLTHVQTIKSDDDDGGDDENDTQNYGQNHDEYNNHKRSADKNQNQNESVLQATNNNENFGMNSTVETTNSSSGGKAGDVTGEEDAHKTDEDVSSWETVDEIGNMV